MIHMKTVTIRVSASAYKWLEDQCLIAEQEQPTITTMVDALIMCYDQDFKERNYTLLEEELKIKIKSVEDEIKLKEKRLEKLIEKLDVIRNIQIDKEEIDEEQKSIEDPKELMMKTPLF
jgi:predicted DNA-binding protein YlxM (UPF0122 family)